MSVAQLSPFDPNACCQNCGTPTAWEYPFHSQELARCCRCRGWSHIGELELSPEALYDKQYFCGTEYMDYAAAGASHARNFKRKLSMLQASGIGPPEEIRMLEVGCASGEFMRLATDLGVLRMLGIEPSAYCRELAFAKGLRVLSPSDPDTRSKIARLRPNLIVGWDVWEHLREPAATLDELLEKAAPAVVVALTTIDSGSLVARLRGVRWRQFHPPTHLHYPTRKSLRDYFTSRGFAIGLHRSFGYHRPLMEYLRAIGMKTRPGSLLSSLPVYLNLFDIQLILARRGNVA